MAKLVTIKVKDSETYEWNENSTYIQNPPFFEHNQKLTNLNNANILALFGDSITTDHISLQVLLQEIAQQLSI